MRGGVGVVDARWDWNGECHVVPTSVLENLIGLKPGKGGGRGGWLGLSGLFLYYTTLRYTLHFTTQHTTLHLHLTTIRYPACEPYTYLPYYTPHYNTPTLHYRTLLAYHTLPYTPHHTTLHYTAPYLHYTELHIKDPAVLQCSVMVLSYVQWNVV